MATRTDLFDSTYPAALQPEQRLTEISASLPAGRATGERDRATS